MAQIKMQFSQQKKLKILCLHGGGEEVTNFYNHLSTLMKAVGPDIEFFLAQAPNIGNLWVLDPPLGKKVPTLNTTVASASVNYLNRYLQLNGPFDGILGYSQGAMFATYYLSVVPPNTFAFALMFCGYLPTTHLGLLNLINKNSPFDNIRTLVFSGANDYIIHPSLTDDLARKFNNPIRVISYDAGHHLPKASDKTFNIVVNFIRSQHKKATLEGTRYKSLYTPHIQDTLNSVGARNRFARKAIRRDAYKNCHC